MIEKRIEIFFCYAREDEELRQSLEKQLRALKRQGLIDVWHDRLINPGTDWVSEIDNHLSSAQIILLLISPDFMDSDYCYGVEMMRAMERHRRGEARVIPVILRPTLWQGAPFSGLQALPPDAIPVVSRKWHSQDEAFFAIAEGLAMVVEDFQTSARRKPLPQQRRQLLSLLNNLQHYLSFYYEIYLVIISTLFFIFGHISITSFIIILILSYLACLVFTWKPLSRSIMGGMSLSITGIFLTTYVVSINGIGDIYVFGVPFFRAFFSALLLAFVWKVGSEAIIAWNK